MSSALSAALAWLEPRLPTRAASVAAFSSLQSLNLDRTESRTQVSPIYQNWLTLRSCRSIELKITDTGIRRLKNLSSCIWIHCHQWEWAEYLAQARIAQDLSAMHQTNDLAVSALAPMKQLQRISLSGSHGRTALIPIGKLSGLHSLELNATHVTSKGLKDLVNLPKLEILSLDDTQLGEAAAPLLIKLTSLKLLSIVGAHVPGQAVERLRVALPECEIRPR